MGATRQGKPCKRLRLTPYVGESPIVTTEEDFAEAFDLDGIFKEKCFSVNNSSHDLYFWGTKQ